MPDYCANTKTPPWSEAHEVHDLASTLGCLPAPANRKALGTHSDHHSAVREARAYFSDVSPCARCCPAGLAT